MYVFIKARGKEASVIKMQDECRLVQAGALNYEDG